MNGNYRCTKVGCSADRKECRTCGFEAKEMKRRKKLPLVELKNGLRGKIIKRRTAQEGNGGKNERVLHGGIREKANGNRGKA